MNFETMRMQLWQNAYLQWVELTAAHAPGTTEFIDAAIAHADDSLSKFDERFKCATPFGFAIVSCTGQMCDAYSTHEEALGVAKEWESSDIFNESPYSVIPVFK